MVSPGRPRTFDRELALKKAMHVFWEKGYEGATMSELIAAIGMKAPSIYAAFGNKDALFAEVVNMYAVIVQKGPLKALVETPGIYQAMESALQQNVALISNPENPPTCLIMSAAINCTPDNQGHIESLRNLRSAYKKVLLQRFNQAVADKELVAEANPQELAEFYMTIVQGLALRARDGMDKAQLEASSRTALSLLKPLLTKKN